MSVLDCVSSSFQFNWSRNQGSTSTCKDVATGKLGEEDAAAPATLGTPCPHVKGTGRCVSLCFKLRDSCLLAVLTHHRPRMLPFCQLVQDPKQINTRKEVSPAKLVIVTCFLQGKPSNHRLLHSCRRPQFPRPSHI